MPKLNEIIQDMQKRLTRIKNNLGEKIEGIKPSKAWAHVGAFLCSWWRLIVVSVLLFLFLYYPLGGWIVEDIDTDTNVEISAPTENQSKTVEMMAYLVRREVNDKLWTPNLPIFFPSYFLDNMPNFQLGMMSGISSMAKIMAMRLDNNVAATEEHHLKQAAKLLQYPGTIWMFSPTSNLTLVPSANSQYRKARKQLVDYNQKLNEGSLVFYRNAEDLAYFLRHLSKKLYKVVLKNESCVREESSSWFETVSDDFYYYAKGLSYADYMLLKAVTFDYKKVLSESGVYANWTRMLNALEQAAQISPMVVRNGDVSSCWAPNHLLIQGFYMIKAHNLMQKIANQLEKTV